MTVALWVLAALLVVAGIAGVILPLVPGIPLVFAGLFLAAWLDGFHKVGWLALTILGVLTVASFVVEFAASALGAKRHGASRRAVLGAVVGTVIGLFFGLPGLVLGPFAGAVVGEYTATRDLRQAQHAGIGTWLGMVLGTAAKLAIAFAMLGIFALAWVL